MPSDHYAVVIGLTRYPLLDNPPPDLQGPENDVDAVVGWLVNNGGVPVTTVKVVRSSAFGAPPEVRPTRDEIEEAFLWLDQLAEVNRQHGRGRQVGSRIYLYASGHGFSPRPKQACLLAANASQRQLSANVFPSGWIDWLQDANYFSEYVLWVDCCMDRAVLAPPPQTPLDPLNAGGAPRASFTAFAAPRPLKAAEKQIPEDGKWHGVFTWNLLKGLRGAAADKNGAVNGRRLTDWLRQAQPAWLDPPDLRNPEVAKEPAIVDDGADLFFPDCTEHLTFTVSLQAPQIYAGKALRLWSGWPALPRDAINIPAGGSQLNLEPGFYVAEIEAPGGQPPIRHGFAVVRDCSISLNELGAPPKEVTGDFQITVDPNDPTAEIRITGEDFAIERSAVGRLQTKLPAGPYQVLIRIGRQLVDKVILLDSDWPQPQHQPAPATRPATAEMLPELPIITSAAPLPQTRATHEYLQEQAEQARTRVDVTRGDGAQLMVMARSLQTQWPIQTMPWDGVQVLVANGVVIADLSTTGQHSSPPGLEASSNCSFKLDPGNYILRYPANGSGPIEQALVLPRDWRLEAYLLTGTEAGKRVRPTLSLLMRLPSDRWGTTEDVLLEKARVALADERALLKSEELEGLLVLKFSNPLAGIIGGHLLLITHEKEGRKDLGVLNDVVKNLRALVGSEHPDVEALSLACPDEKLRRVAPITAPPIFERSWRLIVAVSQQNPLLVPADLWRTVHAQAFAPPFLAWSGEQEVQAEFRSALIKSLLGPGLKSAPLVSFQAARAFELSSSVGAHSTVASVPSRLAKRAVELGLPPVALSMLTALSEHLATR